MTIFCNSLKETNQLTILHKLIAHQEIKENAAFLFDFRAGQREKHLEKAPQSQIPENGLYAKSEKKSNHEK